MTSQTAHRLFAFVAILGVLVAGAPPALACCCEPATLSAADPAIAPSPTSDAHDDSPCCPGGCEQCPLPCCGGVVYALPLSLLTVAPVDVPADLSPLPPPALRSHLAAHDLDRPPRS